MTDASFADDLPEDPDAALAAEYVLRLLDPAEEAACAARVEREPGFAAEVGRWQAHFSGLDPAFAEVNPPASLEARITELLFGRPPSFLARIWGSAPLWRGVAAAAIVLAAVLGFLARPVPVVRGPELVATVSSTTGGDLQLVALLDRADGRLRFTHVAGAPAAGRSFELWILPEGQTVPASLGVIPAAAHFEVAVPERYAAVVGPGTQVLVSDEAEGGSTTGNPGPVLAQGAISEL